MGSSIWRYLWLQCGVFRQILDSIYQLLTQQIEGEADARSGCCCSLPAFVIHRIQRTFIVRRPIMHLLYVLAVCFSWNLPE